MKKVNTPKQVVANDIRIMLEVIYHLISKQFQEVKAHKQKSILKRKKKELLLANILPEREENNIE